MYSYADELERKTMERLAKARRAVRLALDGPGEDVPRDLLAELLRSEADRLEGDQRDLFGGEGPAE